MSMASSGKPTPKGNIVVTSSCATLGVAFAGMAYTTAKNGCNGLVKSGAVQLSSSNICVNAVAPGPTTTSIFATSELAEEGAEYKLEKTAEEIQNDAAPEEIANFAVSLASDLPMAMNGQVIVADSGKSVAESEETFIGPVPAVNTFIL
ncbi:hypothetical protein LT330_000508 [Penicillium expansum]|nr:hypothetical protein LT330_000508 [Penicillium expansum]